MNVREMLEKAVQVLTERGLKKGAFVDAGTGVEVCMMGALYVAAGRPVKQFATGTFSIEEIEEFEIRPAMELLALEIDEDDRDKATSDTIVDFNDSDDTTLEDVLLVFKRAVQRAE